MNPPRAVLDTNVFVGAGFNPRSASAGLLRQAAEGSLVLVWSPATRAEAARILGRIPRLDWDKAAPLFRPEHERPDADPEPFAFVADPADRMFAALAVAADAVLVTSDDHLLVHRERLPVTTPGAMLRRLG